MSDYRYRQPLPGLTSKRSKTPQPLFQTPYQFGRSFTGDHSSAVAMAREEALNKLCGSPKKPPSPKRQPPRAYCPPSPSSSSSSSSSSRTRLPPLQHETPHHHHHPLYHQRVEPSSSRSYKPTSSSSAMYHHHYKHQHPRSSRPKVLSSDDEDDDLPLIYTLSPPRSPLPPVSPGRHPISQSLKKLSGARELNRRSQDDDNDDESDDDGIPLADEMRTMMRVPK
ncbi:hypothetical protein O0I10_005614 [Lichtheimia ornata]|uniref:Uncharacterized protein n=1 Tax=Lichtheimia ornata TaxID=688661 RepID=A0AAD7V474_9FUNG|nr:uncharacterized protein O0I10_005614 [Lichtheimia ornata]KAJ8658574.1 hypothetical protein O0I10_005614 [Lichtheimia ornata]